MTVMTDVTVDSSQDDKLGEVPRLDENPWAVSSASGGYHMDLMPDSSMGFPDMPTLESQEGTLGLPCSSPVSGTFFGPEPAPLPMNFLRDVKDPDAEQGSTGLHNMGNTCFMNAGLQCLLCNPRLVNFLLEEFELTNEVKDTLTGCFTLLLRKIWSGQFSVLHPSDFKNTLAMYHPQFKDFRQHDCQEFLALLLDNLHEQLNSGHYSTKPYVSDQLQLLATKVENFITEGGDSAKPIEIDKTPAQSSQTGSPVEAAVGVAPPMCFSEDSNQSEPSHLSIDSTSSGDCTHRLEPIPDNLKSFIAPRPIEISSSSSHPAEGDRTEEMMDVNAGGDVTSASAVGGECLNTGDCADARRLPSIEDLYMKDNKTLNTNVLVSEFENDLVSTDSEKFLKPDNTNRPETEEEVMPTYEQLNDLLAYKPNNESPCCKPVKDTNLLVNVKDKFTDEFYSKKCLFSELDSTDESCSINNIKRMKVDDGEKNVRMQEKMKVNIDKNVATPKSVIPHEDNFANVRHDLPSVSNEQPFAMAVEGDQQLSQDLRMLAQGNALNNEDQLMLKYIRDAQHAWDLYKEKNRSIIVDTFQGQFKSTVICSECNHVSVTFEPFMYLSVPLPHAMERQISVIFVPSDNKKPIEYLLTLNKQDHVRKLKQELLRLIGEESCDIVVAEVLDNHIARILEDNTMLRFVNDSNRDIYAFEMIPAPQIDQEKDLSSSDSPMPTASSSSPIDPPNNVVSGDGMVTSTVSSVSLQTGGAVMCRSSESNVTPINLGELMPSGQEKTVSSTTRSADQLNNSLNGSGPTCAESLELRQDVDWQRNLLSSNVASEAEAKPGEGQVTDSKADAGEEASCENQAEGDQAETQADQWKSCAICLEEMVDSDLMVHTSCGGTLCQSCLEMSFKHYGETTFVCPVCSTPVNPAEDFIQLNCMDDYKPKTRILSVPIIHRHDDYNDEGQNESKLFGHPNIMYMASQMNGEFVYSSVDRVVACPGHFSIVLTDGQGLRCSRCLYTAHCTGCEVPREGQVSLQPGDHLTVTFADLNPAHLDMAGRHLRHSSMDLLRSSNSLTLFDCFEAFTESEILDEHNPWYCPRCRKNQCAKKTMTVWKYPDTLVVYLKRFVFHELSSTKIDAKVEFPLEELDLSGFISGPHGSNLVYDLQSCVCHFGGSNSGHYTSYAKHPTTSDWHYYNDETMAIQRPRDEDYSNAYILFYQRRDSNEHIRLPDKIWCNEYELQSEPALGYPLMPVATCRPGPLNNETVTEMLEQIQEAQNAEKDRMEKDTEPDSTNYDFYE